MTVRTRRANPPRFALNTGPAAHAYIMAARLPDEPVWATLNRLFGL